MTRGEQFKVARRLQARWSLQLNAVPPISRTSPAMGNRNDRNLTWPDTVDNRIWKASQKNAPGVALKCWPLTGRVSNRLNANFQFSDEFLRGSDTSSCVPSDRSRRFGVETCRRGVHPLLRSMRRARTSGHRVVCTAPDSNSTIRPLISSRHFSSTCSSLSESILSSRLSARPARASGGRERACLRISPGSIAIARL